MTKRRSSRAAQDQLVDYNLLQPGVQDLDMSSARSTCRVTPAVAFVRRALTKYRTRELKLKAIADHFRGVFSRSEETVALPNPSSGLCWPLLPPAFLPEQTSLVTSLIVSLHPVHARATGREAGGWPRPVRLPGRRGVDLSGVGW